MKIISAPYAIKSTRSIAPTPSSITADGEPARSVQPVFRAPASNPNVHTFSQNVYASQNVRESSSAATAQIAQVTYSGPAVARTASALEAYRQADMLRLQNVEADSIIL